MNGYRLRTNVILNTGTKESVNRHLKSKIFQPPKTCPGSIMYKYNFKKKHDIFMDV